MRRLGLVTLRHGGPAPETARVFLYRRPILDEWCERGDVGIGELIAHVLIHEIGHHLGQRRRRRALRGFVADLLRRRLQTGHREQAHRGDEDGDQHFHQREAGGVVRPRRRDQAHALVVSAVLIARRLT